MRKSMLTIAAILLGTQPLTAQEPSKVVRQEGWAS